MAHNFQGWLLKFGDVQLPNSFLLADGFESTPNQRMEIDAYRDADTLLHRETADSFKTKIKITIRELTLDEKLALHNVIGLATLSVNDKKQRKIRLTYWNDEDNSYASGNFYIPDITYQIHKLNEQSFDIEYNSFSLTMIEY